MADKEYGNAIGMMKKGEDGMLDGFLFPPLSGNVRLERSKSEKWPYRLVVYKKKWDGNKGGSTPKADDPLPF